MDIENKLIESASYKSNALEKKVEETLNFFKWTVHRSPYYLDPVSKKYREVDIMANYRFAKTNPNNETDDFYIEYSLILECKNLSGYHIIFDGEQSEHYLNTKSYHIWSGYDNYDHYKRFRKILKKTKVKGKFIPEILKNFSKIHFPDGFSSVGDFCINPMNIKSFSTFRETNIGKEKELDNSVVWKAFQELQSVIKAQEIENYENIESDFLGSLAIYKGPRDNKKIIAECSKVLKSYGKTSHLTTIHPVLIVNCKLWETTEIDQIMPLKYSRLMINDTRGYNMFWFDIVDINYIQDYINYISEYYLSKH